MLATFAENRLALAGVGLVVLIVGFCFIGPLIYRTNQVTVNLDINNIRPGGKYPLGTDNDGFNVLGRLMVGGQSSLELGFAVSIATSVIGTLYGAHRRPTGRSWGEEDGRGDDAHRGHVPGAARAGAAAASW